MKRNIILIGPMGSGKSHMGRNLAEEKGWQFVDTDRILEQQFNMPIADIFKQHGEKVFRRAEFNVLKRVALYHEAVISLGGNFPLEHRTLRYLQRYSYIIGIRAADFRIVNRVNRRIGKRPTMDYTDVPGFVEAMLKKWHPVYKKCDYVVDTTHGHTASLLKQIIEHLKKNHIQFKKRKRMELSNETNRSFD